MSTQLQQLQQQKIIAKQNLDAGKITQQQYDAWVANQNQLITQAQTKAQQNAQTTPAVYYKRTPTGIETDNKIVTITTSQGPPNKQVMTQEQKANVLLELTKVNAASENSYEAIARGETTYIPIEQKQIYRDQLQTFLNTPTKNIVVTSTPKPLPAESQPSSSGALENNLFSGKRQGLSLPFLDMGTAQPIIKNNEQRVEAIATIVTLPIGGSLGIVGKGAKAIATSIAKQALVGGAVSGAVEYVTSPTHTVTVENVLLGAAGGVIIGTGGAAAMLGVSKVAPSIVASRLGRTGINVGVGAVTGYGLSGGDPMQAAIGGATGGIFSLGGELVYNPTKAAIASKLGLTERLVPSTPTIGKSGEQVPTFVSKKPIEALGNRQLRIVTDVTENPIGTKGVTIEGMIKEYVGQKMPTAHATLNAENFNLKKGGETLLQGFPEQSAGYRAEQELYHFYSAPGSDEFVNVYGGYAGMANYEDSAFKLVVGGKATALVTTDTPISKRMLPLKGESESDYIARTSLLSGETGIAQETVLGKSMERQFITTAKYERQGIPLAGSKFITEGKVGKFQIHQVPTGKLGKIPIVKDILATDTDLTVYKGKYGPAALEETPKATVDLGQYNRGYEKTLKISTPKALISKPSIPSIKSNSLLSVSSDVTKISSSPTSFKQSPMSSPISLASMISQPFIEESVPSQISKPSQPSILSNPLSPTSLPSKPSLLTSNISTPSQPISNISTPSRPSTSKTSISIPSKPYRPTYPYGSILTLPTSEDNRKRKKRGQKLLGDLGKQTRYYPVVDPKEVVEIFL